MAKFKHSYWGRQIDGLARELSRLAIACDIELGKPGLAERILKNDESVCGRKNPEVFRQIRQHLTALFSVEVGAVERAACADAGADSLSTIVHRHETWQRMEAPVAPGVLASHDHDGLGSRVTNRAEADEPQSPAIPPGASAIRSRSPGTAFAEPSFHQAFCPCIRTLPLSPDNATQSASYPPVQFFENAFDFR